MSASDPQQKQMIQEAMKAIAERKPGRSKLVYDKSKRTIVAVLESSSTPRALEITAEDADMFAPVTISTEWLVKHWAEVSAGKAVPIKFSSWDSGDAFTHCALGPLASSTEVAGHVVLEKSGADLPDNQIRIGLAVGGAPSASSSFVALDGTVYTAAGVLRRGGIDESLPVAFVDVQPALAARRAGILETDVLKDQTVLGIGMGTGGGHALVELAKCGVGEFILVDHDRLSVGNVVRHLAGISQVGRLKVNVLRDLILEKNPDARVTMLPIEVLPNTVEKLRPYVSRADVVLCATDKRPSKLLINQICVEENVPVIFGGAFRRAYGGQVLRVRPRQSPCFQCFVAAMPEESSDNEISSIEAAEAVAYSDRPVAIEPGLSMDVVPIANMAAKLALLELLEGKETGLKILKRDFSAPWYLWINRPEPNTPYAKWPPLSDSSDEMTIDRWYGIEFERDGSCPACGNFTEQLASKLGLKLGSVQEIPAATAKDQSGISL